MKVYSVYWIERNTSQPVLDDVFPIEEPAKELADRIFKQENIESVYVVMQELTRLGLINPKDVYSLEKPDKELT